MAVAVEVVVVSWVYDRSTEDDKVDTHYLQTYESIYKPSRVLPHLYRLQQLSGSEARWQVVYLQRRVALYVDYSAMNGEGILH